MISTIPADAAGVFATISVFDMTVTSVAGMPPTVTVIPSRKFSPVMVIGVPPATGPRDAEMSVIVKEPTNVKATGSVEDCPSGLVTTTSATPADAAGVVTAISVAEITVMPVATTPPMVTCAPSTKSVPAIAIVVPPVVGPLVGVMLVTLGGEM